jgi:competence protein ComFC
LFTQSLNRIYQVFNRLLDHFWHLISPNGCIICDKELTHTSIGICHLCEQDLNYTKMENEVTDTKTKKLFWGRFRVEDGFSLLYFSKGNSTQKILHGIKYQNQQTFAIEMGRKIGTTLQKIEFIKNLDALIPVPIHSKKRFDRGYNQSELLSKGISEILNIQTDTSFIKRIKNTKSQTKLNKYLRWENAQQTYRVNSKLNPNWKHIALVDDVITTGSTIESISKEILNKYPTMKISVISLALSV